MNACLFSVVMSVYRNDHPGDFWMAFQSILNQTVPPAEIVIVVDGPVGEVLEQTLAEAARHPVVKLMRMAVNVGLGQSRHAAILATAHEWIAVMDSDDICVRERFEWQLQALSTDQMDLVGGFIEEFQESPGDLQRIRRVPLNHEEIVARAHWRQPFNHVTIFFRKSAYLACGGYPAIRHIEDYSFFFRAIVSGMRFCNLPKVLVHVRCGKNVSSRRHGWPYLQAELALFTRMYRSGFISAVELLGNALPRLALRLLPLWMLGWFYDRLLRSRRA